MKRNIKYLGLATFVVVLIFQSCKKETDENYISNESPSSLPILGTKLSDFPGDGRTYGVSFCIGTKIYVGFGSNYSGPVYDLWEWDYDKANSDLDLTTKNMWTKLPDFSGSVSKNDITEGINGSRIGLAVNGKGYILTGVFFDNGNLVNEFWEFDPETNLWTQKENPPVNLVDVSLTGFSIGSKLYIGTGESLGGALDTLERNRNLWEWDQTTDTWTQKADFPGAVRGHATGFSIGDKGYIGLGGKSGMVGVPLYHDLWEYNPETDNWTQKADFPGTQQWNSVAFSIGNKGYVTAGVDHDSESASHHEIWEWDQTTNTWTKVGIFAGDPRSGAAGGALGNRGYLLLGASQYTGLDLNDFWLFDFTSD